MIHKMGINTADSFMTSQNTFLAGRKVIYLASGRSVSRENPGRKIRKIHTCWQRMGVDLTPVFGGDLPGGTVAAAGDFGHVTHHNRWYRRTRLLDPLVRSVSEYRDLKHNRESLLYLRKLTSDNRPELIWERSSRLHCSGLMLARELGVPYVLEWKDNLIPYRFSLFRPWAIKRETRKNLTADFLVTESNVIKRQLIAEGCSGDRIIVAHNAVDADEFRRNAELGRFWRGKFGISADEVLIGYLGSYAFYHQAELLVQATALLRESTSTRFRVLMVGNGLGEAKAKDFYQNFKLDEKSLLFHPAVPADEVPGLLSALDIAVLPGSTDIICPIKVQEYMAAGVATVAPGHWCNREVIEDGVDGMLFGAGSAQSLAEAITRAFDHHLRTRLGIAAREKMVERFNWESTWGAALERAFEKIG